MAIVQISRITQRKGLQEDLPQLAGAEFGWSVDTRRLFIGNGTLEEGAPVVGNTEILTEFSDILAFQTTYTYKGEAAGYVVQTGPTANNPVTQSLQSWLDQFATVKDFGAVGDGVTDDTDAINRALYQLYCREVNPQIRRSLFFPAGVYKISQSIVIPPFATLYGEGPDNSVIQLTATPDDSALTAYVARTGDSLQQTGVNIGNNNAIVPQYVTITNLGFQTLDGDSDVFLVDSADNCSFNNVNFTGPLTTADLDTDLDNIAGVRFNSTASLICKTITFDRCVFSGTTFGINTDEQIQSVTVSNSRFDTLFKGVLFGENTPVNGGPVGVRIVHNLFDNIYAEGVEFGADISLNGTGHNIFLDVGNHFAGSSSPATAVVNFQGANNVSWGDMFERTPAFSLTYKRVEVNDLASTALINGSTFVMGTWVGQPGISAVLNDNVSNQNLTSLSTVGADAFTMTYTIVRDTAYRTGTFRIVAQDGGSIAYDDDFVENSSTGITLTGFQSGGLFGVRYTSTSTGTPGSIKYRVTYNTLA